MIKDKGLVISDSYKQLKKEFAVLSVFFSMLPIHVNANFFSYSAADMPLLKSVLAVSDSQSVIEPKVSLVKEVLNVLKTIPSFIESNDYVSLSQILDDAAITKLRETLLNLKKYLPIEQVLTFEKAYTDLVVALNSMKDVSLFQLLNFNSYRSLRNKLYLFLNNYDSNLIFNLFRNIINIYY
jgi:hypothetical protein